MKTYTYYRDGQVLAEHEHAQRDHSCKPGDVLRMLYIKPQERVIWYIWSVWGSWLPTTYADLPKDVKLLLLITQ